MSVRKYERVIPEHSNHNETEQKKYRTQRAQTGFANIQNGDGEK
jgi:hypothetical protein